MLKYQLFLEPNSNDLIIFIYTYDISQRIIENEILEKLSTIEYEALSIMDIATRHYIIKGISTEIEGPLNTYEGDYDELVLNRVSTVVIPEEREQVKAQFQVDKILSELSNKDVYNITYSLIDNKGQL